MIRTGAGEQAASREILELLSRSFGGMKELRPLESAEPSPVCSQEPSLEGAFIRWAT